MALNVKELNRLANYFAKRKKPVQMGAWMNACGTDGCIAGRCVLDHGWKLVQGIEGIADKKYKCVKGKHQRRIVLVASDILGLTKKRARQLFYTWNWEEHNGKFMVPSKTVAKVIRHYIREWTKKAA